MGSEWDEEEPALGVVPVRGRGGLPFALVHGESLVAAASWALTSAEVELFDLGTPLEAVREAGRPLVVHDPLCPLTPSSFIDEAVALCRTTGAVVVGARPVTDTVKVYDDGRVGATVDREELVVVTSPVVLPAAALAGLEALEDVDLPALVEQLASRAPVRYLQAPPLGRRITSADDLAVLEALSRASGRASGPA